MNELSLSKSAKIENNNEMGIPKSMIAICFVGERILKYNNAAVNKFTFRQFRARANNCLFTAAGINAVQAADSNLSDCLRFQHKAKNGLRYPEHAKQPRLRAWFEVHLDSKKVHLHPSISFLKPCKSKYY